MNRQQLRSLPRIELQSYQLQKLTELVARIRHKNDFYLQLWKSFPAEVTWEWFTQLPTFDKRDLVPNAELAVPQIDCSPIPSLPAWQLAANHTFPPQEYSRVHRTSGTSGRPLVVLDTREDWQWWLDTWQYVLDAARVEATDRDFLAFSFGPFIGFWSAFEACQQRGSLMIPGGGLSTLARLELIRDSRATIVGCTPSYALHLAEVAEQHGWNLAEWNVRAIIVAGEPGGCVASTKQRIEELWGAKLLDHAGATEIGPWGFGSADGTGLHVIESEFIAEFLPKAEYGEGVCELVLTNLGRVGCPVIRYRTGDLVKPVYQSESTTSSDTTCRFVKLEGGILGRADDMVIIRGVNIFPTSIEAVLRSFDEVDEFRIILFRQGNLDQLKIEVEGERADLQAISVAVQLAVGLRIEIQPVAKASLPRFEGKAKRLIDQRASLN
jgi:phenylacetate-CoA ligase